MQGVSEVSGKFSHARFKCCDCETRLPSNIPRIRRKETREAIYGPTLNKQDHSELRPYSPLQDCLRFLNLGFTGLPWGGKSAYLAVRSALAACRTAPTDRRLHCAADFILFAADFRACAVLTAEGLGRAAKSVGTRFRGQETAAAGLALDVAVGAFFQWRQLKII
jgi:hypothetical protein